MSRSYRTTAVLLSVVLLLGALPVTASAGGKFTLDKAHKYLGFGTVALAGATAASNGEVDIHESLAYATAAFAISTVLTGYLSHRDRFDTSDGFFTKDNTHIMLGTVGAILLTTGVLLAADSFDEDNDSVSGGHAGLAIGGGVLMTIAIVDIEW